MKGSRGAKRSRRIPITKPVTGPRSLNSGYSMRSGRVVYDQKIIWVFAIYSVQVSPVIGAPEPGIAQAEVVVSSVYRIDPTKPEAEGAADASQHKTLTYTRSPTPHPSSATSFHGQNVSEGGDVPPPHVPQAPDLPGRNAQELLSAFATFMGQMQRAATKGVVLGMPFQVEPIGEVERVLTRFHKQRPPVFKGSTSDPMLATEWVKRDLVDIDEKRARQFEEGLRDEIEGSIIGFQIPTNAEVLKKAQIFESCSRGKAPLGKELGKRPIEEKNSKPYQKFKRGDDIAIEILECTTCGKKNRGECKRPLMHVTNVEEKDI
ncbi:hypothetical protein NE237_032428 [Protea cynaroides]|uniref:Uncharacterized protein n=1 Tax=Protea cynaroides TaxID=273540 RepID=A0A9Q0L4C9_9MAGN|nr:hypothetical protein NE237_032428 [Protea cynaroides]